MEEIVKGVVAETTDEYNSYIQKNKLETLVYICLNKKNKDTSQFERHRLGVHSEEFDSILEKLCKEEIIEENVRPTFGGEKRYFYQVKPSYSGSPSCLVKDVCEEFGDIPISNLQKIASSHSW